MDTAKAFIVDINKQPYVSLEGKIDFDTSALPKIEKIMSRHDSIDDFIKNESLSNKMVIARYLNTGKWEDKPISLTKIDDNTARNWGDMILKDYAGIDTRGLIKVDVGIGAHVDEFALEKKLDNTFRHYLDPERQGSSMKAGRVFQELQGYYKPVSKVAKEPKQMTKEEYFTFTTQQPDKAPKGLRPESSQDTWVETGKFGEHKGEKTYYLKNADTGEIREWPLRDMARMKETTLSYDELIGNIKSKQDNKRALQKVIFGNLTVSATDASDAGRELSEYGHQKAKYTVRNKSNKSTKSKSRRNSTAGMGSVR